MAALSETRQPRPPLWPFPLHGVFDCGCFSACLAAYKAQVAPLQVVVHVQVEEKNTMPLASADFRVVSLLRADFRAELRRLNRELLFAFADMLAAISERPSQSARSVETVGILARNLQHLLNLLRPHQVPAAGYWRPRPVKYCAAQGWRLRCAFRGTCVRSCPAAATACRLMNCSLAACQRRACRALTAAQLSEPQRRCTACNMLLPDRQ